MSMDASRFWHKRVVSIDDFPCVLYRLNQYCLSRSFLTLSVCDSLSYNYGIWFLFSLNSIFLYLCKIVKGYMFQKWRLVVERCSQFKFEYVQWSLIQKDPHICLITQPILHSNQTFKPFNKLLIQYLYSNLMC